MEPNRTGGAAGKTEGGTDAATARLTGGSGLRVEGQADRAAAGESEADPQSEVERLRAEVERLSAEPATPRLDAVARAADRYDRRLDTYLDNIRERPLAAIGVAALAGFLVGRFLVRNHTVHRI
jgi:ElaB/YqjD/DUF883 family membrane-anchored ribosome-binding protein